MFTITFSVLSYRNVCYLDSDTNEEITSSRRSNRREIESRDDLPLHNAPLQELLSDVLKQENAWPFLRPVQKNEVR